MTEKMNQLMKDVPAIRWTALILLASAMFFRVYFYGYTIAFTRTFANIKRVVSRCRWTLCRF